MSQLAVRVLGRPQLSLDEQVVPLGERSLLLALRLALGRRVPVSAPQLRDAVWPDQSGTDGALRVQLTRLRSTLGADAVVRHPGGYTLSTDTRLDADRFEALLGAGRDRGNPIDRRIAALDEALNLWTGRAFDGIEDTPWLASDAVRLDELREQAVDDRFELRALVEDAGRLVADLRAAAAEQPTRERRAELLAVTLYRAGRQTDALRVIEALRTELRDRLGLSPSPSVADLELRILRQDERLLRAPVSTRPVRIAAAEGRLRAALALMKAGASSDAMVIVDEAAEEALAAGDRRAYANVLLTRAQGVTLGGLGDPRDLIEQARTIARELRDGPLLARCSLIQFGSGVPDDRTRALVELTEPLELLPTTAPERIDLLCAAAVIVTIIDASDAADQLIEAARRTYERIGSERAEAVWLAARSIVGAVRGADIRQVEAWAADAAAIARRLDDPTVSVVTIQALLRSKYMRGDLAGIDSLLDTLERDSVEAGLSFGLVRVSLARTTNALARGELQQVPALLEASQREGERLRTFAAAGAVFSQQNLLLLEQDRPADIVQRVLPLAERAPSVWHAVLALAGERDAEALDAVRDEIAIDDSFMAFVALAAEVAARDGHASLGTWCAQRLDGLGELAVTVGIGSIVLGFAAHSAGWAHLAAGDRDAAIERFDRARALGIGSGADLWAAHSAIALAAVLADSTDRFDVARASELAAEAAVVAGASGSVRLARKVDAVRRSLGEVAPGG